MIFLRRMVESEVTSTEAILFTLLPLTFRLLKLFSSFFFFLFLLHLHHLFSVMIYIYIYVCVLYVCVCVCVYIYNRIRRMKKRCVGRI